MARFLIGSTISAAFEDLKANKLLAAQTYGVMLCVIVLVRLLSLLLPIPSPAMGMHTPPAMIIAGLVSGVINFGVFTWVLIRWSGWVVERVTGAPPPAARFWPSIRATMKLIVMFILALLSYALAGGFGALLIKISPVIGFVGIGLVFGVLLATTWALTRLTLIPFRAAIGEGTSIGETWRATQSCFWRLFGLGWTIYLILLLGLIVILPVSAALVACAIHFNWLSPITDWTSHGFLQWYQLALAGKTLQLLMLLGSVITAPVAAVTNFIMIGAYARVALQLSGKVPTPLAAPVNPWNG